jgi:hypothetical protein
MAPSLRARERKKSKRAIRSRKGLLQSTPNQRALSALLTELAGVFVLRGITPRKFNDIADQAFVAAAANLSKLRNGRTNQSRIAAITGMRRSEIRKHLQGRADISHHRSPVDHVLTAWSANQRYRNSAGRPKRLNISGGDLSFATLVKNHVGDIPHRAVLDEMRRIGAVRKIGTQVEMVNATAIRRERDATSAVIRMLPLLLDGVRAIGSLGETSKRPMAKRLVLYANSLTELALIRGRCVASINSFVEALGQSLGFSVTVPRRSSRPKHSCTVSVLFAEQAGCPRVAESNPKRRRQ